MKQTYIIGPSKNPYKSHNVTELGEFMKVTMTCGGGMGGARWEEYGTFVTLPNGNTLCEFKDAITGSTVQLGTAYIVKIETVKIIKATTDVTPHYNYHEKKFKSAVETFYYAINPEDGFRACAAYGSTTEGMKPICVERDIK